MRLGGVLVAIALVASCGKVESDSNGPAGGNGGVAVPSGGGSANAPSGGTGSFGGAGGTAPGGGGWSGGGEFGHPGAACAVDAECGSTQYCAKEASDVFGGESPAKGYCTYPCAEDPSVCEAFNQTNVVPTLCHTFSNGESFCLEGCNFGPSGLQQLDPNKCHGRQEVACRPLFDVDGGYIGSACFPQCNSDADCGGTLVCNPKTGLCTTTLTPGQPLGTSCAAEEACQGLCHTFQLFDDGAPLKGVCTSLCTVGALPSCGWEGPGTEPAAAACLYAAPDVIGAGIGDLGYCGQLCDCDADCPPDFSCGPWPGPDPSEAEEFYQRAGYCGLSTSANLPCVSDGG